MSGTTDRKPQRSTIWVGTGLLLAVTLGSVLIRRLGPSTTGSTLAASSILALGTLAMAGLALRSGLWPRWGLYSAGLLMAIPLVLSAAIAKSPVAWEEYILPTALMMPWYLLLIGILPAGASRRCFHESKWAGWLLTVTGALLSVFSVGIPLWLGRI